MNTVNLFWNIALPPYWLQASSEWPLGGERERRAGLFVNKSVHVAVITTARAFSAPAQHVYTRMNY